MFFSQQSKFSANTLNTHKVEHGDDGSTLIIKQLDQTVQYLAHFIQED
jgi:hypothetical protein